MHARPTMSLGLAITRARAVALALLTAILLVPSLGPVSAAQSPGTVGGYGAIS